VNRQSSEVHLQLTTIRVYDQLRLPAWHGPCDGRQAWCQAIDYGC